MPRIVGVDVPANKRVEIALTYIYGVGDTTAKKVCKQLQFKPDLRAKDLTEEDVQHIADGCASGRRQQANAPRQSGQAS